MGIRFSRSLSFIVVRTTTAICIALTWLGLYTQQAAVSQNSRSETKYSVREIFPKKEHIRRQVDYAERTAHKALRSIESMHCPRAYGIWTAQPAPLARTPPACLQRPIRR